ncbi:MAG: Gfo/Idh/MocA family oxidoreductase, partial [Candidatus Sumerlaeia bacterium]|nr:Gfo/Idh/MocA family oxidoreductase [Candidatus Sumerlaeia bacterium]
MSDFHIGLVGFGNIGTGVVRHLQEQSGLLAERCGRRLVLKAICDKDLDRDRGVSTAGIRLTSDYKSLTTDPSLHAIIELVGGTTIAKEVILSALSNGKHVVTAN